MSRSRNIKPGFFRNEVLVELPYEYRLLFIGLWTLADREGRFEDRPTKIKMEIFPADAVDVNAGLQSLHTLGFIRRYTVDGNRYCQILAWARHQNPHKKEGPSLIPEIPVLAPEIPERAGLIPDSLNLIPDSLQEIPNPNGLGVGFFESNEPPADDGSHQGAMDDAQAVAKREVCPVAKIVALYHESLPKHPRVEKITPGRAGNIRARWREDLPTLDAWKNYFQDIAKSKFLTGRIDAGPGKSRPFIADLEWITKSGNFAKIAEGRYHE